MPRSTTRTPALLATAALALCAATSAGCSSPAATADSRPSASGQPTKATVVFNVRGKPVADPAQVLTAFEAQWHREAAESEFGDKAAKGARCYFQATTTGTVHVEAAQKEATAVVCGPVDAYTKWEGFNVDTTDQGTSWLLSPRDHLWASEPNAPAGFTLQRPDGATPPAGSDAPGADGTPDQ